MVIPPIQSITVSDDQIVTVRFMDGRMAFMPAKRIYQIAIPEHLATINGELPKKAS